MSRLTVSERAALLALRAPPANVRIAPRTLASLHRKGLIARRGERGGYEPNAAALELLDSVDVGLRICTGD